MTKKQRIKSLIIGLSCFIIGVLIILNQFNNNIIFFYSPSDLFKQSNQTKQQIIRIGGVVKKDSIHQLNNITNFTLTDFNHEITVSYQGLLPNLFREDQGMVAKGQFIGGKFIADELLAKHDENYMPKEVADSLKKAGRWQPSQ